MGRLYVRAILKITSAGICARDAFCVGRRILFLWCRNLWRRERSTVTDVAQNINPKRARRWIWLLPSTLPLTLPSCETPAVSKRLSFPLSGVRSGRPFFSILQVFLAAPLSGRYYSSAALVCSSGIWLWGWIEIIARALLSAPQREFPASFCASQAQLVSKVEFFERDMLAG